ncbi:hypothetical protein AB0N67_24725 [Streptomyces microflavus]|uniref:hypothetical protein n=1 Tax=Streptomyces microflavus TaxID=1919 RepID=UPI0034450D61
MTRFNRTGFTAHFHPPKDQTVGTVLDVEAWHPETGDALVADLDGGRLRSVNTYPNFDHLEGTDVIIGAVPGGDWRIGWEQVGDEPIVTEPVPAWLITRAGFAHPVTTDLESAYGEALSPHDAAYLIAPQTEGDPS